LTADVIGRTDDELLPPPAATGMAKLKRPVLDRGETVHEEFRLELPEHNRWFLLHARPLRKTDGTIAGLIGVTLDITERRAAEEARRESEEQVRRLNVELEQRVRDRTAQLEAANKELEAFNYSVSHDLRAPLRAIDGFAHILREDFAAVLGDEGRRVLGVIVQQVQRMDTLVRSLLDLSRLGQQALDFQAVDMRELATLIGGELESKAGGGSVDLRIEEIPAAWGDVRLLRQVLANLLENAFKFTGRRTDASVTVGGRTVNREQVYFVADNGVGFEMARSEHLFGVFQRLHSEEEFPGSGVGLALVKRIVQRHGGRVWAEGRVGQGAKFFFALPVALMPADEAIPLSFSKSPFADAPGSDPSDHET
jgi:light-regulated signal transduction histidine kinase (bacteriophytochrome)